MKLSIDTKEDSHEDLKKVIKMLQHIVGDSQEVFTNQPSASEAPSNPFANIFGDNSSVSNVQSPVENSSISLSAGEPAASSETPAPAASESTEDLFAELFSEEDIKKMESVKTPEDEDEEEEAETKPKSKKHDIEFY